MSKVRTFGGPRSRLRRFKGMMRATSAVTLLGGGEEGAPAAPSGDGGTPAPSPAPSPSPTPAPGGDPWYSTVANDEHKTWLSNKGYATLEDAIAGHRSLEQKFGAGRFNVPTDWNDAAQATAAYKALGLPDQVGDAYKLELPEGSDPAFSASFAEAAHKSGILPHQFKAIGAAYMEAEAAAATQAAEAARVQATADIEGLKAADKWGADFEKNDAIAGAAAKAFGFDGAKMKALAGALGTAGALEFLVDLGKKIGEDGIEGGQARQIGAMSGAQAAEQKKAFMADATKIAALRAGDPAAKQEWQTINAAMAAELDRAGVAD